MRYILGVLLYFCLSTPSFAAIDTSQIGLGFQIFDPTGITAKVGKTSPNSAHVVLGWGGRTDFQIQGDYLWNHPRLFPIENIFIDGYYGLGARLQDREDDHPSRDPGDDDVSVGARVAGGLRWLAPKKQIEIYADLGLVMDLIPSTDADLDFALGFHFFF